MIRLDGRTVSIVQGNTGSLKFRMYGPDRTPFNVTGYTFVFMVKKSKKDPDSSALISKIVENTETNEVTVTMLPEDTKIPVATYWWGLQVRRESYVNECASGPFYVKEGVVNE